MFGLFVFLIILMFAVLILLHEFGHFIMAKLFKIPVLEFAIGMGPTLISKRFGKTVYSIKALPLGGSCFMAGEDATGTGIPSYIQDMVKRSGYTDEELRNGFDVAVWWKRLLICLAGPLMNLLIGFLLCFLLVANIGFTYPIVTDVTDLGALSAASPYSIQQGDEIVFMETDDFSSPIYVSKDIEIFKFLMIYNVATKSQVPLSIKFKRNGQLLQTNTTLNSSNNYQLGIFVTASDKVNILDAGLREFKSDINSCIQSVRLLFMGRASMRDMSGPVGITNQGAQTLSNTSNGDLKVALWSYILFVIYISISLGIFNLLPIPIIDGGLIVYSLVEPITYFFNFVFRGKREPYHVSKSVRNLVNNIFFIILFGFMILVMIKDILACFNIFIF